MAAQISRSERVNAWTRTAVRGMKPYYKAPLDGNPLRLDQNTNLFGPNPVLQQVEPPSAEVYPTRDGDDFLQALADFHGLSPDNFIAGNGSDEILDIITKTFTAPGQAMACPAPSYSLYPFYAQLQDLQMRAIRLTSKFGLDVDEFLSEPTALTIIANPNNPTGNAFPEADLLRLIQESDHPVVIDEAYIEYAGLSKSLISRVEEFDNLLVMRTLSKAYGLAGLRIGYVAGNLDLMERLRIVKPPFNLNRYSEAVGVAAIQNQEWVDGVVSQTRTEREWLDAELVKHGFKVHKSAANFLLCEHVEDPVVMQAGLRNRGILVRTFATTPGLERKIRFGVGTRDNSQQLLAALGEILA